MRFLKNIIIIISLLFIINVGKTAFDFELDQINLSNGGDTVSLYSKPSIDIKINNIGNDIAQNNGNIPEGFILCIEKQSQNEVFKSSIMSTLIINPGTYMIASNLELKDTLTQTQRTVEITCSINNSNIFPDISTNNENNIQNNNKDFKFYVDKLGRFDSSMDRAINPIREHLDAAEPGSTLGGGDSIKNFIFNKIINVVTPIIIIVGILMGIIGGYRLFFSNSAEETKKGFQLVVYGILGIIIILSARYLGSVIFEDLFQSGNAVGINGVDLASQLYEKIAYPFIKIVVYLSLGVLFVILAGKVFSLISKTDGSNNKKAGTMIARSAISMLIIIGSKQIVEAIYGKQNQVLNQSAQNLGEIGSGLLADKNIPILYSVINRVMGLTSLVILIIILYQTFQILMNPDKADNWQKVGKSILYIMIGVFIIGAGYLITNFLIIN